MQCEVCGRQIAGKPHRVIIEGAKMTTCAKCAELGSAYWEPEPEGFRRPARSEFGTALRSVPVRKKESAEVFEDLAVVENFGSLVRQAREKLGLSHEDLGKKIAERVSVIKKVENEKMVPDRKLAAKLERTLRIRLLVPIVEPESVLSSPPGKGVTLGEIVVLKNGKRRRPINEVDHSRTQRPA